MEASMLMDDVESYVRSSLKGKPDFELLRLMEKFYGVTAMNNGLDKFASSHENSGSQFQPWAQEWLNR